MIPHRTGRSLIEVLVALAVVAVLVGVLLSALQKARGAANRTAGMNNLRQIMTALQQVSAGKGGRLPGWAADGQSGRGDIAPLAAVRLLLYPTEYSPKHEPPPDETGLSSPKLFRNPSDPSYAFHPVRPVGPPPGNTSFAANFLAFSGQRSLTSDFPDGLSNTIAFAEHYARCGPAPPANFISALRYSGEGKNSVVSYSKEVRRASFADRYYDNVYPVTTGKVTLPSRPGATFQSAPAVVDCDPTIPQTPHAGGMTTSMLDGSVRVVRSGIAPEVFWAAVTPAGGESVPLD